MTDTIHNTILPMTDTTVTPEDYTGEDGLLYCGKCHKPKEAYFPEARPFSGVTATRQSATASGQPARNGKLPKSSAATLKRWND